MTDSTGLIRARFHELRAEIDAIEASAEPHRVAYDAKRNEIAELERRELQPLIEAKRSAEVGLFEKKQELAVIARALDGKTGPAPAKG